MSSLLAHQLVESPRGPTTRLVLFCHGVFGMGTNWRTVAKTLASRFDGLGAVLVDLRGHGGTPPLEPPHDLDAAADDVVRVIEAQSLPVVSLVGHSFGGKVVLDVLDRRPRIVGSAFIVDSMPGPRAMDPESESAAQVLGILESLPATLESREAFKAELARRGLAAATIDWLAMNVRREGDGYALRLDLPAIRSMLVDYFNRDLWDVVDDPRTVDRLSLIIAGKSTVFDSDARARAREAAAKNPNLEVTTLPASGHWVHVDDPEGLLAAVSARL
jgi:pimeloyl-ACP methyl ester carboxylesterase